MGLVAASVSSRHNREYQEKPFEEQIKWLNSHPDITLNKSVFDALIQNSKVDYVLDDNSLGNDIIVSVTIETYKVNLPQDVKEVLCDIILSPLFCHQFIPGRMSYYNIEVMVKLCDIKNIEISDIYKSFTECDELHETIKQNIIEFYNNILNQISSYVDIKDRVKDKINKFGNNTKFSFDEIIFGIEKDMDICLIGFDGQERCCKIKEIEVRSGWMYKAVKVTYQTIQYMGGNDFRTNHSVFMLTKFDKEISTDELPFKFMSKEIEDRIIKRNQKFLKLINSNKNSYFEYTGDMRFVKTGVFGMTIDDEFDAAGKVVLDPVNFYKFCRESDYYDLENSEVVNITNNNIKYLSNTVLGFSLKRHKWGEILINKLSKIKFRKDVMDHIQLPQENLGYMKQLVTNINKVKFRDFVDDKSGGQILLFYGGTGTGKTLTAEALAELRQVPLYHLSAGELGSDINYIEENLNKTLELVECWDAILLFDEADVFLQDRTNQGDIVKNAVVSVFLRLLEYFTGTLILTTNLPETLDPAIISRVTAKFKYDDLTETFRRNIWKELININIKNFKHGVNLNDYEYNALGTFNLNGREIKSIVKNAICISIDMLSPLTYRDFKRLIITHQTGGFKDEA